eukprot:PhM_4_TR9833/c2_g1_i1/m.13430
MSQSHRRTRPSDVALSRALEQQLSAQRRNGGPSIFSLLGASYRPGFDEDELWETSSDDGDYETESSVDDVSFAPDRNGVLTFDDDSDDDESDGSAESDDDDEESSEEESVYEFGARGADEVVPITPADYRNLTRVKYTAEVVKQSKDTDKRSCSVCFEDFKRNQVAVELPCGHRFGAACIRAWLTRSRTCPLCRHIVADVTNRKTGEEADGAEKKPLKRGREE